MNIHRIVILTCGMFSVVLSADFTMPGIGKTTISGSVELELAEIMYGRLTLNSLKSPVEHQWYSHFNGFLDFESKPTPTLTLKGGFEFRQYMNMSARMAKTYYNKNAYYMGEEVYHDFFLREAQGIFKLIDKEAFSFDLAMGYIPYKYNPEVRELGEFLFRTGTYPFYIVGEFDRPFARLTGFRGTFAAKTDFLETSTDFFILTEREIRPFWDVTIAGVTSINFAKFFEIGLGVDFAHLIPTNPSITTPDTLKSRYFSDSTVADDGFGNMITTYDTAYYTFQGTKLMARATIDPFGRIRNSGSVLSDVVGKNGGKLYGEIAVIGLKDYPANDYNPFGYDNFKEKMPWMAGITIPFWKILDICAIEFERYPNPYPNSAAWVIRNGLPVPYMENPNPDEGYDTGKAYVPRWFWSVYLNKEIVKNFSVVCQIGRDHMRWEMPIVYQTANYDYEDIMVKPKDWTWHIKTIFRF
ncbi:MAG: hypothetical protein JW863_05575 [Chitinispirillaceae bacterium]|nr:hypothetical protein [Chitinispirillaceae bacterium]